MNINQITINDYIQGFECIGKEDIKLMKGWVDEIVKDEDKNIIGFAISADDKYKGYRGTYIWCKYGDITYINSSNLRPSIR